MRQEVVQIKCDRCTRVELQPPQPAKTEPDFAARFGDAKLLYNDLCARCKEAVTRIWGDLKQWDRHVDVPIGPVVGDNKAVPLQPAPDFSPPKPHSLAAGMKR